MVRRAMLRYYREPYTYVGYDKGAQFREIKKCFVRKDHVCGKFLGASKSCFVACPSTSDVKIMTDLIEAKLMTIGIEPVVATKIRAYGQDIFCIKICGKIIESQFCIVILDDEIQTIGSKAVLIPNPNVYFEYGLMTALGKCIVPLQKDGQKLAFNIQTHDTIKYTPENISTELDKALKDATKITEEDRLEVQSGKELSEHMFKTSLEINGYEKKGYGWFLNEDFEDTIFNGYSHRKRNEYVFFTVIYDRESLSVCLMEIQAIIKRLETRFNNLVETVNNKSDDIQEQDKILKEYEQKGKKEEKEDRLRSFYGSPEGIINRKIQELIKERNDANRKVELIQNSKFAVILMPEVIALKEKCIQELDSISKEILRLPVFYGDENGINISDLSISFRTPNL